MGQGVESGQNIRYFVGFNFSPKKIQEEDVVVPYMIGDSLLVIPPEREPTLVLARQEAQRAREQVWLRDVREIDDKFVDAKYGGIAKITADVLGKKKRLRLGVCGTHVPMVLYLALQKLFSRTRFVECTDEVDLLRVIKSENELRIMRKAAEIADEGVRALIETSRPGNREYEIHLAVEKAMFDAGGDNPWSVILTGPRSAISYMSPDYSQRVLREGDMVYADIGSELMGYHSDIQPALIVGGVAKGTADQVKLIETSLAMLRVMIETTHPSVTDTEILKKAYKVLDGNQFRDYVRTWTFGHGYGVGSDLPDLTGATLHLPKSQQMKLEKHMVLCYEPGLFVPNIGGAAVEDEVIVTSDGCEILTHCGERAASFLENR